MNDKRLWAAMLALLLLFGCFATASAETDYVDLSERFDDVVTVEWDGQTYYLKNRVSTTLAVCFNPAASSAGSMELALMIVIDDEAKTVLPLQIDPTMLVNWKVDVAEGAEPVPEGATLAELFAAQESAENGCLRVMEALNGLFPMDAIEKCFALNLDGLTAIDGVKNDGVNTVGDALMERLHVVKSLVGQSEDPMDVLSALSDYIYTDMKSGALMKIADKVDRYDVQPRTFMPVLEAEDADAREEIDLDAFTDMMVNTYFDDESIW